jgi:starch phosphorylase
MVRGGEVGVPVGKSGGGLKRSVVTYDDLLEVALNLRWTWKIEARRLFASLDPEASPGALEWPHQLLLGLGRSRVTQLLNTDLDIAELAKAVVENFRSYDAKSAKTWFKTSHRGQKDLVVAYFAAEYSLTDSLPIFAGGLGTVAAEHLKASSALGVPVVGVGLLYRGTSHQWLDREGRQHEAWDMTSPSQMPIERARDVQGRVVQVTVSLPGRDIQVAVYRARVGRNQLLLLDSAVNSNSSSDQTLTARLYDSDVDIRFAQELILGVGGVRALAALDVEPVVMHLNEGHSAFAVLERVRRVMAQEGLSFEEARSVVRPGIVFTTHTPVAAGHDYFAPTVAQRFLAPYATQSGVELETLVSLGRVYPDNPSETFCPTVFAMRMAGHRNGVSRLHGRVTREQWALLWPRLPLEEVPIGHITNGVHLESWTTSQFSELFASTVDPKWDVTPGDPVMWSKLLNVDDAELWRVKNAARSELVEFTRRRARNELARRHAPSERVTSVTLLDPDRLTIGFVGRFVAYKRPTLLLSDPERLARLLKNPERPVQIVFAGKAHPDDESGKLLLQNMIEFAARYGLADRVVFIVDFDTTMDRALAQGADVWLNTPRRPLEACGVGGMKAGMNGALNFSTVDGWWDEARHDAEPGAAPIGFTIGTEGPYADEQTQDALDAESLYDVLENEIIPRFYERDDEGVPRAWVASMKQSMSTLAPTWDSLRMTREYTESYYLPGLAKVQQLRSGGAKSARDRAHELQRLRTNWPNLAVEVSARTPTPALNGQVEIVVKLGALDPADLRVQLWAASKGVARRPIDARLVERAGAEARYVATIERTGDVEADEIVARVLPSPMHTDGEAIAGLITWSP